MHIEVVKRDGEIVQFDRLKIEGAIQKATKGCPPISQEVLRAVVDDIVSEVLERFSDSEIKLNVENVHDIVEKHLMRSGHYEVAKSYILYRANKRQRESDERKKLSFLKSLTVVKKGGNRVAFNPKKLKDTISRHAQGLQVDQAQVFSETVKNVYDEMKSEDIDKALIMSATAFIEQEPDYSVLAARFFRQKLAKEVFGKSTVSGTIGWQEEYRKSFVRAINVGVDGNADTKVYDPRLLDFDLVKLSEALVLERDELLKYIGVQTLYERYFVKLGKSRLEMPQTFWMRVAMGLAFNEENKTEKAIEFYNVMSQLLYIPSTPTLFHSGLHSPQLSSCYLTTINDDLKDIFDSLSDNAQMSKWSGGIGNDWTGLRSTRAMIKKTMVESQGVIPFMRIANDGTVAISRSGKRRGATVAYLETWHLDIEDFLDLRKNTGDERRRTPDMNTANWIPDLFMKRVQDNGVWTLFSPDEVPDLHDLYGKRFEERYHYYERQAKAGKIKLFKVVEAVKLFRKMITMLFETGHPWFTFKDPCNIRSPQDHVGVVHSSNLCCVAADQLVVTDRGLFTVGEMYNTFDGIKTGYSSWNLAGREGIVRSTAMLMPRPNAPMRKIVTKEGYTHKVTPDHKVWVLDHGHKEAQDLVPGDKIALQSTHGLWGNGKDSDVAFICGLVAGDGTFKGDETVHIDVWEKDAFIIPEVERLVTLILERHNSILKYDHACRMEPKFSTCEGDKYRLTSSALNEVLRYKGFNKTNKLSVPDFVLKGSENTVKAYLRGLYLADGTVQGGEVTVGSLCSTNLKLLEVVQILWANFGAKTSLTKMDDEGFKTLPDGNGCEKEYWCNAKYRLMHTCIRSCRILEEVTKIGEYRKCETFLENVKKDGYSQKMYATFERLEELPNEDAYCLEVDAEDHLWTVNGLLTKNTEITLNTKATKKDDLTRAVLQLGEIAVCNLGSLNLMRLMKKVDHGVHADQWHWEVDWELIKKTIYTAMRMLDNVIDINFYPVPEARNANMKHRPVGLGFMGLQDALFMADIRYEEADDFVDMLQEFISYQAIYASSMLAAERGTYETYKGSKWDRGIFPLDTISILEEERGVPVEVDRRSRLDWGFLKEHVKNHGMRNSNTMAVAPTATISGIAGVLGACGESTFKNLFTKSNMSGEFTVINEFLVNDLKKEGLWDKDMLDQIKFHNGSVQRIEKIPVRLRAKYKEAFEIDQKRAIDLTALRAKWIDQSQSHNVFFAGNSGKVLVDIYMHAWKKGLKTTYYLRTLGASGMEKSTLDAKYGLTQKREEEIPAVKVCRIDDPTCEACQ